MTLVDIVLVLVVLYGAYRGYSRGIITELISLVGLFIAIVGAFVLLEKGTLILSRYWESSKDFVPYVAFVLIFTAIIMATMITSKALKAVLDKTFLGTLDKGVGAVVGGLKWTFGLSVLLWILQIAGIESKGWFGNSKLYPYLTAFAPSVVEALKPVWPYVTETFEKFKEIVRAGK